VLGLPQAVAVRDLSRGEVMSRRGEIAEIIATHRRVKDHRCSCGWFDAEVPMVTTQALHVADQVRALCDAEQEARYECVAQELDYYASKTDGGTWADGAREAAQRIRAVHRG
jgi:hypothetical protein